VEELRRAGADEVIPEEFETSIEIVARVLRTLHVPGNLIATQVRVLRDEAYRKLRDPQARPEAGRRLSALMAAGTSDLVLVLPEMAACGRTLGELHLEEVEVPDEQRIGELHQGFVNTLQILDRGRVSIGALAVGLARGALEESRDYAKERKAFGRPIADFQAIGFALADVATELAAARLLVHRAASLCDAGVPFAREAGMAGRRGEGQGLRKQALAILTPKQVEALKSVRLGVGPGFPGDVDGGKGAPDAGPRRGGGRRLLMLGVLTSDAFLALVEARAR